MRILLFSPEFLTEPSAARSRSHRIARHFLSRGHDLRVLCNDSDDVEPDNLVGIPAELVVGARLPNPATRLSTSAIRDVLTRLFTRAGPGWVHGLTSSLSAATDLFRSWQPDIVYVSSRANGTALIGAELASIAGVPFVTEFRESRRANRQDYPADRDRRRAEGPELKALRAATAIVASTPVDLTRLARRFGSEKTVLALDGFDPVLYPLDAPVAPDTDTAFLHVYYAGPDGEAESDPRIFFSGLAALGDGARDIRVSVPPRNAALLRGLAQGAGIERQLDFLPLEHPDRTILRQYAADALVLSLRGDASGLGAAPRELFECIATGRPIVASGNSRGVAAEMIRRREAGVFTNEPKVVASTLARLLARKRARGFVPPLSADHRRDMCTDGTFEGLDTLMQGIAGAGAPSSSAA